MREVLQCTSGRNTLSIEDSSAKCKLNACTVLSLQSCIGALRSKIQGTIVGLRNKLGAETAATQRSPC